MGRAALLVGYGSRSSTTLADLGLIYQLLSDASDGQSPIYILSDYAQEEIETTLGKVGSIPTGKYGSQQLVEEESTQRGQEYPPDYYYYVHTTDERQLVTALDNIALYKYSNLIIFLSGDLSGEDTEIAPLLHARQLLLPRCASDAEVLLIVGGGRGSELELPFHLDVRDCEYHLTSCRRMALPTVVAIVCGGSVEESADYNHTTPVGALVTLLAEGVNSLPLLVWRLLEETNVTCDVYSSYPIAPVLWSWVMSPNIDIYINEAISALVVVRTCG